MSNVFKEAEKAEAELTALREEGDRACEAVGLEWTEKEMAYINSLTDEVRTQLEHAGVIGHDDLELAIELALEGAEADQTPLPSDLVN